jgi:hypothetical protein
MTSFFHSAYILNTQGLVVGIYFEEQGIRGNSGLLAQAQMNIGLFEDTLTHRP